MPAARLAHKLFQFDDFTDFVLAARTLKRASSTTGLLWLNASKPHWCTAFRANWAHNRSIISERCATSEMAHQSLHCHSPDL
jgi:hypothetical protein